MRQAESTFSSPAYPLRFLSCTGNTEAVGWQESLLLVVMLPPFNGLAEATVMLEVFYTACSSCMYWLASKNEFVSSLQHVYKCSIHEISKSLVTGLWVGHLETIWSF